MKVVFKKKKHKEKRIERLTQKQKKNWKIEKFISNLFCQSIFRKKERKFDRFKKFDFDSLPKYERQILFQLIFFCNESCF